MELHYLHTFSASASRLLLSSVYNFVVWFHSQNNDLTSILVLEHVISMVIIAVNIPPPAKDSRMTESGSINIKHADRARQAVPTVPSPSGVTCAGPERRHALAQRDK